MNINKICENCGKKYTEEETDADNVHLFCSAKCEDVWFIEHAEDEDSETDLEDE